MRYMGSEHSQYTNEINENDIVRRRKISEKGKKILLENLLEAEMHNRKLEDKKDNNKMIKRYLTNNIVRQMEENIKELSTENEMLNKSLEYYKRLYYDLTFEETP